MQQSVGSTIETEPHAAYQSVSMFMIFVEELLQVLGCCHSFNTWQVAQHLHSHQKPLLVSMHCTQGLLDWQHSHRLNTA